MQKTGWTPYISPLESEEEYFVFTQPMRLLEGDEEEVKGGKSLKVLTLNQQLTRLSVLLEQTKAGNNSYKLKKEIATISA